MLGRGVTEVPRREAPDMLGRGMTEVPRREAPDMLGRGPASPLRRDPPETPPPYLKSPAAPAPRVPPAAFGQALPLPGPADDDRDTARVDRSRSLLPLGRPTIAAAAVVLVLIGGFAMRKYVLAGSRAPSTGTLNMTTNPPGVQVVVDGRTEGVTPLIVTLSAGGHLVELRGAGEPRTFPITIKAGTQLPQYMEMPKAPSALGQLQIRTEPNGALATVDGVPRGRTPLTVEALSAGEHSVVLEGEASTVSQSVSVEAGQTALLVVPLAPKEAAPATGWVSASAPVELQLFEKGRPIGTTQSERLSLPAGRHEIEIVNDVVGYRAVRTIQVVPGKVAPISIEWPKGALSINATPWADVWIDGERVGETPLGNLSLPLGPHEIIFRHPDLGEQRYAVTVSLKTQARVSIDMRKKP
jgi:hypothetical protein